MKAIGLLSGGLDSQIAIKLILEQGVEVTALHFRTIFCTCTPKGCSQSMAKKSAEKMDIPIVEVNKTRDFLEVVKNPPHGYGSGMNPCIDCRILSFSMAKEYMEKLGAGFIITGEVVGQRPMSQRKQVMELIEKESRLEGYIIRPLSAGLLPLSIPEQKGWIDRAKLLSHSGRSRRVQFSLAEKYGIKDYSCPAGGCLLTDPAFAKRIRESFAHGEDSINDVQLLKIGRHFRLLNKSKLIIGRNEAENERIQNIAQKGDILIEPVNVPGPSALLINRYYDNIETYLDLAIYACARYCDKNGDIILRYGRKNGDAVSWDRQIKVKVPDKTLISDDYCRRI